VLPKPDILISYRQDTVATFLLSALADGPLPAREIEGMAAREGLLAAGKAIGDAKHLDWRGFWSQMFRNDIAPAFRSARQALGIKPFQQPGRKGAGWIWSLPCQPPSATPEGG
jgi:hypothetical protein